MKVDLSGLDIAHLKRSLEMATAMCEVNGTNDIGDDFETLVERIEAAESEAGQ